jgi:phosphoribosylformylglycinamidine (FGAM) synthase PurS component
VTFALEVMLTIPDNEALTALATLRRLGVDLGSLERADVWRFEVAPERVDEVVKTVRETETIFNPNKHALHVRDSTQPQDGEVWLDEPDGPTRSWTAPVRVAGRLLLEVERAERFVGWRLRDRHGGSAAPEVVDRALETLLCNPAFQVAIR